MGWLSVNSPTVSSNKTWWYTNAGKLRFTELIRNQMENMTGFEVDAIPYTEDVDNELRRFINSPDRQMRVDTAARNVAQQYVRRARAQVRLNNCNRSQSRVLASSGTRTSSKELPVNNLSSSKSHFDHILAQQRIWRTT